MGGRRGFPGLGLGERLEGLLRGRVAEERRRVVLPACRVVPGGVEVLLGLFPPVGDLPPHRAGIVGEVSWAVKVPGPGGIPGGGRRSRPQGDQVSDHRGGPGLGRVRPRRGRCRQALDPLTLRRHSQGERGVRSRTGSVPPAWGGSGWCGPSPWMGGLLCGEAPVSSKGLLLEPFPRPLILAVLGLLRGGWGIVL